MEIASGNAQGAGFREKENLLLVEAFHVHNARHADAHSVVNVNAVRARPKLRDFRVSAFDHISPPQQSIPCVLFILCRRACGHAARMIWQNSESCQKYGFFVVLLEHCLTGKAKGGYDMSVDE